MISRHAVVDRSARVVGAVLACGLLAAIAIGQASAGAAGRPGAGYITGRVSQSGYTIAVVGYNGQTVLSDKRSFRVAAPTAQVTVQLINGKGLYAGPVVFGGSKSKVIVGVRAGANLGTITVGRGYGSARVAARSLDRSRWAYAIHGVPLGNGLNFGLVTSASAARTVTGSGGADPAHIGVPNQFNIAVPGTHILKALAPKTATPVKGARIADVCPPPPAVPPAGCTQPAPPTGPTGGAGTPAPGATGSTGTPPPTGATGGTGTAPGGPAASNTSPWMSQIFLDMSDTVNADASGVTQTQLDSTLQGHLNVKLLQIPVGSLVELNCNGLVFCSQGGTGRAQLEGLTGLGTGGSSASVPFPDTSLDSATGFGEIVGPAVPAGMLGNDSNGGHEFSLDPNAATSQIGSGDVITEVVTDNGVTSTIPTTLDFVFVTVPAITSVTDTAGDSTTISYPDTSGVGTITNPISVAAGPNGDVVATFTVLRPQRQGVPGAGEPAFMDIGRLGYELDSAATVSATATSMAPQCPMTGYSNPSSTLTISGPSGGGFGPPPGTGWLVDSAADAPANSANTISFTADLTTCLKSRGFSDFPVGQPVTFDISANSQSSSDHVNQIFVVERTH